MRFRYSVSAVIGCIVIVATRFASAQISPYSAPAGSPAQTAAPSPWPSGPPYGAAPTYGGAPPQYSTSPAPVGAPFVAATPSPIDAPSEAHQRFGWSLGAGIGIGEPSAATVAVSSLSASFVTAPSARIVLERRLGATTWLTSNIAVSYNSFDQPVAPSTIDPSTRSLLTAKMTRVGGVLGVRQVVARGVVELSLLVAMRAGILSVGGDEPRGIEQVATTPGSSSYTLGAVGGLVVERELTAGLAARLSMELMSASFTRADQVTWSSGQDTHTKYTSANFGLALGPALLLQFYF